MQLLTIVLPLISLALVDAAVVADASKSNTFAPGVAGSTNAKRGLGMSGPSVPLEARAQSGIICSLNNCYVQGFSNGAAGQNEIFVGSGLSPAACKAACQARSGCVSFAVQQDGSGNCYTEQHTVVAEIVENCGAPFFFYDVGCNA